MHAGSLDHLTHSHAFLGEQHNEHERRTWLVVGLTFSMMVAEIAGGEIVVGFGGNQLLQSAGVVVDIGKNQKACHSA